MRRRELLAWGRATGGALGARWLLGCSAPVEPKAAPFRHGVGSADPAPDRLLLWTRLSDAADDEALVVLVATDERLTDVVAMHEVVARADEDFVVHVDVAGLEPGRTYYYAFEADGVRSEVGRARTAPEGSPEVVRFVLTSCASYAHGYFHTYAHIAEHEALDAVLHVGDYIYEYGDGEYGDLRPYDPPHRVITLDDYRRRFAYYRRDPDLRRLHARHPLVITWDDHEIANNAWPGGSFEHAPASHGPWPERRAAAERAHAEWLPRRVEHEGALFRRLAFGDLVDLFVLDTRMERDAPPATAEQAAAPGRSILGAAQREWLLEGLTSSRARWKVIAHSVQLSPHAEFWNFDAWDGYADERRALLSTIVERGVEGVVFLCGDGHKSFADDVPLDPHEGYDPATGAGSVAVEVMTPGASSPNFFGAVARDLEALIYARSPHTKWIEAESRGYWVIEVRHDRVSLELIMVDGVERLDGGETRPGPRFEVVHGRPWLVPVG